MLSPYEELEFVADYLPEEGEVVVINRKSGELVCKPWTDSNLRNGIDDPELYGFLVRANEQLYQCGVLPFWALGISVLWLGILVHGIFGFSWTHWYLTPAIAFPLGYAALLWIRNRQLGLFRLEILPQLNDQLQQRSISPLALIAGVRQHGELRYILDELVHQSLGTRSAQAGEV